MDGLQVYNLGMTAVCAVFGGLVTYYAVRAARRTGHRALWFLAIGVGFIALGATGTIGIALALDLRALGWIGVLSTLSAFGFVVLGYSLYVSDPIPKA